MFDSSLKHARVPYYKLLFPFRGNWKCAHWHFLPWHSFHLHEVKQNSLNSYITLIPKRSRDSTLHTAAQIHVARRIVQAMAAWHCVSQCVLSSEQLPGLVRQSFFPGLFFYVYTKSPNPKKPRRAHTTGPKPNQLKTQSQNPNLRP